MVITLVSAFSTQGECLGSGYLDVQAVAFENPYGKDSSGANCEFWPWDHCDHRFSFCLLSGGSCTTSFHTGTYWDAFYVDFGNPMAGGIANPMRFHFPDEYPVSTHASTQAHTHTLTCNVSIYIGSIFNQNSCC